jgi:hypothetical protein
MPSEDGPAESFGAGAARHTVMALPEETALPLIVRFKDSARLGVNRVGE